jgi:hypothetical protein
LYWPTELIHPFDPQGQFMTLEHFRVFTYIHNDVNTHATKSITWNEQIDDIVKQLLEDPNLYDSKERNSILQVL